MAVPDIMYVPTVMLIIISAGMKKSSIRFGLVPSSGVILSNSPLSNGLAPSLTGLPSSYALNSAFFIGPKSGLIPAAIRPTINIHAIP